LTNTHLYFAINAKNNFGIDVNLSIKRQLTYLKKNIPSPKKTKAGSDLKPMFVCPAPYFGNVLLGDAFPVVLG